MSTEHETEVSGTDQPKDGLLVYPQLVVPFVLLILCFAAWGSAATLGEVRVRFFQKISPGFPTSQSGLVTSPYSGASFRGGVRAALINRRYGYKTGVLTGLGLAAI